MSNTKKKRGIIEGLAHASTMVMQKFLPDAYIFAVILTIIVFVASMIFTKQGFIGLVGHWGKGVWSLLAFSMQMVLVLVTGHVLALSPPFKKLLDHLSNIPKTPAQGIALVSIISYTACILNWGFGLIIGAIYAKEIARKVKGIDYRLLIASAYSGFVLWHAGFSGSVPLVIAGGDLSATGGSLTQAVPVSQTLFSPYNIFIVVGMWILLPIINVLMHPKNEEDVFVIDPALIGELKVDDVAKDDPYKLKPKSGLYFSAVSKEEFAKMTPAEKLENSCFVNYILAILGFAYIVYYFASSGKFDLNLNIVNLIFLMLGVLLHRTPRSLIDAFGEASKGASGIILQFPLYAGIMGMMTGVNADGLSLAHVISNFFVHVSTVKTFPLFTFLSAGIVNLFVPSGGGQWVVQGPIMMPAGLEIGVDPAKTAMCIAYGDSWTNMIQPFWALPALGLAKLGARDIMGYTLIVLIVSGLVIGAGVFFL
ncbi:short-chain fatty acid transporter [Brachyspira catarrhinii]|uniref:Short-chain fatty acid transporter n=1 Tax=Brachyspira catarrhinii TaxID=2528966 RepID=A0ABY2TU59_9SPIR|nr:short-chain fatty acid transporter [Brachyspira catarrhinii]TKZ36304.1 short-chain fatty acid transporter [Brachyspira catarrhinii]